MSKHIAVVTIIGHGHVNPTLPLVDELVRRGHRISYATGPEMIGKVERVGATGVPIHSEIEVNPSNISNLDPERIAERLRNFIVDARKTYPQLLAHFEQDPPDVICYDTGCFIGRLLAHELDTPEAVIIPNLASNEKFNMMELFTQNLDRDSPVIQEAFREMQDFMTECGLPAQQIGFMAPPTDTNFVLIPRFFQIAEDSFDERFHFIGPTIGSRGEEDYVPADPDAPLLYIALGTVFNQQAEFYRTCLAAFADTRWQVAMSIGDSVTLDELGEIPANVEVRSSFPQQSVLSRAHAFLTHNGMGSTMEALHFGVPMISNPQMAEQHANADRIETLGLGRKIPEGEPSAESIRALVDEVADDPEIRARHAETKEQMRRCGGARAAADIIDAL